MPLTITYTAGIPKKSYLWLQPKIIWILYENKYINSSIDTEKLYRKKPSDISAKKKECTDPFPKLYLLMKVHKQPLKTRPVVSCSGSLLHPLGVWLDTTLQPIATSLPSFIASSYDLKEALNDLPPLPDGALLFTADAVSMYTNIDTFYACHAIRNFLQTQNQFKDHPLPAILGTIDLIMNNNIFQFGDCYFLQKTGTAMGTLQLVATQQYTTVCGSTLCSKSTKIILSFTNDTLTMSLGSGYQQIQVSHSMISKVI